METSQAETMTASMVSMELQSVNIDEPLQKLFDECLSFISAENFIV